MTLKYTNRMPNAVLKDSIITACQSKMFNDFNLVRPRGLEPRRLSAYAPQLYGNGLFHIQYSDVGPAPISQVSEKSKFYSDKAAWTQGVSSCLTNTQKDLKTPSSMPMVCQTNSTNGYVNGGILNGENRRRIEDYHHELS